MSKHRHRPIRSARVPVGLLPVHGTAVSVVAVRRERGRTVHVGSNGVAWIVAP